MCVCVCVCARMCACPCKRVYCDQPTKHADMQTPRSPLVVCKRARLLQSNTPPAADMFYPQFTRPVTLSGLLSAATMRTYVYVCMGVDENDPLEFLTPCLPPSMIAVSCTGTLDSRTWPLCTCLPTSTRSLRLWPVCPASPHCFASWF